MFRSLHMKLVLIMVLLIVSLMTVVGAFLMNSVVRFYLNDFNERMTTMFSAENMDFYEALTEPYDGEQDGVEGLQRVLKANGRVGGRRAYPELLHPRRHHRHLSGWLG